MNTLYFGSGTRTVWIIQCVSAILLFTIGSSAQSAVWSEREAAGAPCGAEQLTKRIAKGMLHWHCYGWPANRTKTAQSCNRMNTHMMQFLQP